MNYFKKYISKLNLVLKKGYVISESLTNLFGVFGFINYPIFYLIFRNEESNTYPDLVLRLGATICCLGLLIKDYVFKEYKKYHYIYWVITVTYCIPFLGTFLFLYHEASSVWTLNIILGLFWLILVVDFASFMIIFPVGVFLGVYSYILTFNNFIKFNKENFDSVIINSIWIIIAAILFSRKKELIVQKQKLEELKQLNEELKVNKIELENALAVKTEFLNNMSHEIRTPIQGFMGVAEELDLNWNQYDNKKKHQYMHMIAKNAKRLASLVGNLLDLTKFNQGKIFLEMQKVNLNNLIENIIDECNTLYLDKKKISFQVNLPKQEVEIIADNERLIQVLRNLFINAIKFTKENSVISVELANAELTYDDGNKVYGAHFSIKDQGVGVPISELEEIFDPFTQSSLSKTKAGGTGLGLAICCKIIKAHHGKIWAENNVDGEGAIFHFMVPSIQEQQMKDHEITDEHIVKKNNSEEEKKTIMIIDDEETILATMEIILTTSDYKVIQASSGAEGLEMVKENSNKIGLIFLDLMMPDMYGLNVLVELKNDKNTKDIPVIIQSGASDEKEKQKCFKLGASSLITKPYTRNQVLKEIDKFYKLN